MGARLNAFGVLLLSASALGACAHTSAPAPAAPARATPAAVAAAPDPVREQTQVLAADTPRTIGGVRYTVPAGWTLTTRDRIAIVSAPEDDVHYAIVETGVL